jgi:hypothetical protein
VVWEGCQTTNERRGISDKVFGDFIVCFQYRADAIRFREILPKRLGKFSLILKQTKTKLVEFGRFASNHADKPETIYFLGFTHFCTRNRKGKFMVGRKTEKTRHRRCITHLSRVMEIIRHKSLSKQVFEINQILLGIYAYYGMGGNIVRLQKIYRFTEQYWCKMLSSRSQRGNITWKKFHKIKETFPLRRPRLYVPYSMMKSFAVLWINYWRAYCGKTARWVLWGGKCPMGCFPYSTWGRNNTA